MFMHVVSMKERKKTVKKEKKTKDDKALSEVNDEEASQRFLISRIELRLSLHQQIAV